MLRIGSRFARVEPRRRVAAFVRGLLAGLPRTNCWTIAEHAGDTDPRGMQRLLSQAVWDADCVRDDLRGYVTEHLGDPDAVLVVNETGDVKKGTCTVGVQRQYTGTAGRIENSQVAVYLAYAAPAGYAFIEPVHPGRLQAWRTGARSVLRHRHHRPGRAQPRPTVRRHRTQPRLRRSGSRTPSPVRPAQAQSRRLVTTHAQ